MFDATPTRSSRCSPASPGGGAPAAARPVARAGHGAGKRRASGAARVLAGFLLALLSTSPARTLAEAPGGDAPFRLPKDWRWEAAPLGAWQARRDFSHGHAVIRASRLPRAADASGATLDAFLAGVAGSPPAERGGGVTAWGQHLAFGRWTGTEGALDAVVLDDAAPDRAASAGAAGRAVLALVLTSVGLGPRYALYVRDDFDQVVRSVHPGPPGPLPPVPPGAGGLEGTVTGLHFVDRPDGEGGTETRMDIWVLLFDPDGRFSRVPPAGEGGIAAHCRTHPGECGTYQLLGGGWFRQPDRIVLREGSGRYGLPEIREMPFERRGKNLDIGGTHLYPAAVLPGGAPFEGTWHYLYDSVDRPIQRELTLGHDGRFHQAERSLRDDPVPGNGREALIASGRYAVEGTRLLLDGDDGRRASFGIVQPDADSDAVLIIGGDAYFKRAPG